jgi:hypothetical protein
MLQLSVLLLVLLVAYVAAECPNACSAHGKCGDFDSCECYRNWMSNDCSERVCQFGLAHVDTPKGDLDSSSGALSAPSTSKIARGDQMYPQGTDEQFPFMADTDDSVKSNTAHYYMECSNKGICDRDAGECECFDGYEGSACQRASCPTTKAGACSGHGTCRSIAALAAADNGNHYNLWDSEATMGCECDPGYTGADCSGRLCKYGFDPLHYDDEHTVRYSNYTFIIGAAVNSTVYHGTFSLVFYDAHGEDWETAPITIGAASTASGACDTITKALEDIPNDVIPDHSVLCHFDNRANSDTANTLQLYHAGSEGTTASNKANVQWDQMAKSSASQNLYIKSMFTLAFPGNPGYLKQPEINIYLDGNRPTLYTETDPSPLKTYVYPNGFTGEDVDYVPDFCSGVRVKLTHDDVKDMYKLETETSATMDSLLKTCLGDADADPDTIANDILQWDYGTLQNPHLVKLVDTTAAPASLLCSSESSQLTGYIHRGKDASDSTTLNDDFADHLGAGWCVRRSPPGFYVALYYDIGLNGFYVFNRAGDDYPASAGYKDPNTLETVGDGETYFHVFTTTGTLQVISSFAQGVTHFQTDQLSGADRDKAEYDSYHSKTLYTYFSTAEAGLETVGGSQAAAYDISCEYHNPATDATLDRGNDTAASYGITREKQLACLEKGDLAMVFAAKTPSSGQTSVGSKNGVTTTNWAPTMGTYGHADGQANPKYLNIYRVERIGRVPTYNDSIAEHDMIKRNTITFDRSLNAKYILDVDSGGRADHDALTVAQTSKGVTAKIYKFTPPTTAIQNTYAGECSTRGICNRADALCECFAGYTGDNCMFQNALAE